MKKGKYLRQAHERKTEREIFEAKKKANDDAVQNNKTDFNVQNEKGDLTEIESTPYIQRVKNRTCSTHYIVWNMIKKISSP